MKRLTEVDGNHYFAKANFVKVVDHLGPIEDLLQRYDIDLPTLETLLKANAEGRVRVFPCYSQTPVYDDGTCVHCESCGSGEWLVNQDENENNYCGQCGVKLEWPTLEKEKSDEH